MYCLCIWRHLSAFFKLFKENGINKEIEFCIISAGLLNKRSIQATLAWETKPEQSNTLTMTLNFFIYEK